MVLFCKPFFKGFFIVDNRVDYVLKTCLKKKFFYSNTTYYICFIKAIPLWLKQNKMKTTQKQHAENPPPFQFNDGGRKHAGYVGTTGDCVCRAICIASGLPYQKVYDTLANGNATQRQSKYHKAKNGVKTAARGINVRRKWFQQYMSLIGFVWTPTMLIGQGCKVHLKSDELPKGRLVVAVSKHYTAVIDGVLNDIYDCSRSGNRCVYGYYTYQGKLNNL